METDSLLIMRNIAAFESEKRISASHHLSNWCTKDTYSNPLGNKQCNMKYQVQIQLEKKPNCIMLASLMGLFHKLLAGRVLPNVCRYPLGRCETWHKINEVGRKKVLNANCRNTTGSYLGHRTCRKTDGCHYIKTLIVIFVLLLMNESCLSPVSVPWGQRLRQDGHRSGCSFCRYRSPSVCPTTEVSQQNHTVLAAIL